VRGEYCAQVAPRQRLSGSSPRARGIHTSAGLRTLNRRFIPACAGNTIPACAGNTCRAAGRWDMAIGSSPRARGIHASQEGRIDQFVGSSPRARGIQNPGDEQKYQGRFIPACAGNTRPGHPRSRRCTVHPRVRGEYPGAVRLADVGVGSSPRARGILVNATVWIAVTRFIPACAGNTKIERR